METQRQDFETLVAEAGAQSWQSTCSIFIHLPLGQEVREPKGLPISIPRARSRRSVVAGFQWRGESDPTWFKQPKSWLILDNRGGVWIQHFHAYGKWCRKRLLWLLWIMLPLFLIDVHFAESGPTKAIIYSGAMDFEHLHWGTEGELAQTFLGIHGPMEPPVFDARLPLR